MPRDLPGLYWDEDKKRYFPISSRPAGTAPQKPAPPNPSGSATHSGQQEHDPRKGTSDRRRGSRTDMQGSPSPKRHRAGNSEMKPSNTWSSLNSFSESTLGLQRRRCMQYVRRWRSAFVTPSNVHIIVECRCSTFPLMCLTRLPFQYNLTVM